MGAQGDSINNRSFPFFPKQGIIKGNPHGKGLTAKMDLQLTFTVPGQEPQTVLVDQNRMIIGTLLSNHVVVRAAGVDPIHAMIELNESTKQWLITDLGSVGGVRVNGRAISVEEALKLGDRIEVGTVELTVQSVVAQGAAVAGAPPPPPPGNEKSPGHMPSAPYKAFKEDTGDETRVAAAKAEPVAAAKATVRSDQMPATENQRREQKGELLFSPRKARPSGDVLEAVAYWSDTVLDIDLFHPSFKGYDKVSIGDPSKANFIAGGKENITHHALADVSEGGYRIRLLPGMEARLRRGGKVETVTGPGSHKMGRRDIAHIKYEAVRYFLLFVRPPSVSIPRSGPRDPILTALIMTAAVLYLMTVPLLWFATPKDLDEDKDDVWTLVALPKKENKPKPIPKPKVQLAQVKTPPPTKKPPKPKAKPVKAAPPVEKAKPKQVKPVKKPVKKSQAKATDSLTKKKTDGVNKGKNTSKSKSNGMVKLAKKPDFKKPGAPSKNKSNKTGGAKGGGMLQKGAARKGKGKNNTKGVEGPKNKKASGVNLKLKGLGVGKILNKTAAGAIKTNFKNSKGGAGGGDGTASRTYGLGGSIGKTSGLGIAGSDNGINNFGGGSGGNGSGQYGSGGLGGAGVGKGIGSGKGRAQISLPPGDPAVSGGLTPEEIMAVIRRNLNQIRHCYEQLLQRSPRSSGRVRVAFVIGGNGRVKTVSASNSTIKDSIMKGCVTSKIKRWQFPKPRGATDVDVKYPFVFTPL